MRLFNSNPKCAFEWLPKEQQMKFSVEAQRKYDDGVEKKTFDPFCVMKEVFDEIKQKKVKKDIARIYGQLCNYTHPNFLGWQEIMGMQETKEVLLASPALVAENADGAMKITLYLIQLSFKTFVETFRDYLNDNPNTLAQLSEWQGNYNRFMTKYMQ